MQNSDNYEELAQFTEKTWLYILAVIGYLVMLVGTPVLASNVPNSSEVTMLASAGVVLVFFFGAWLIGFSADKLKAIEVTETTPK